MKLDRQIPRLASDDPRASARTSLPPQVSVPFVHVLCRKQISTTENTSTTPAQCCFVSEMAIYRPRIGRHFPKVSAFMSTQSRNVRFHGLLQGCSVDTWYLILLLSLFGGLSLPSASPCGCYRIAGLQRQVIAAEAQSMRAIQSSFDFHMSSAQACAYLLARNAPAPAIPFHGLIGRYTSRYAHTENLLQTMGT